MTEFEELQAQTYWSQQAAKTLETIKYMLGFLLFIVGCGVLLMFMAAAA